jgi:hypothetical protein
MWVNRLTGGGHPVDKVGRESEASSLPPQREQCSLFVSASQADSAWVCKNSTIADCGMRMRKRFAEYHSRLKCSRLHGSCQIAVPARGGSAGTAVAVWEGAWSGRHRLGPPGCAADMATWVLRPITVMACNRTRVRKRSNKSRRWRFRLCASRPSARSACRSLKSDKPRNARWADRAPGIEDRRFLTVNCAYRHVQSF